MATSETRLQRGTRRGRQLQHAAIEDLREKRVLAGLSQAELARELGCGQAEVSRLESEKADITLVRVAQMCSLLGLRPRLELYPLGEPLRDAGQMKLIACFRAILAPIWHVMLEAPFPTLGDLRSWDVLLRLSSTYRIGVEAETRVRDQQELVRRIRQRELHGGVDAILIILSDSLHNRRLVGGLREALGSAYATPTGPILASLRTGQPLAGSGVVLR